ncbi:LLM class flavin-dependent oxidoreductase [Nonomuraea sp. NPDC059007]|uniref:LLM class flavin-dependent oxidoreductase n=1 Tax=Nonomuraea sp. NPDC059007 TaxID=3346692 RepID=UPI0036AC0258
MDVGVGLPAAIPGTSGSRLLEWALLADELGFSSVGVLDRLIYGNFEPVTTLAAAAAVTQRVRLAATVLVAAYRGNAALLAKQLATVQEIAAGRLVVGVACGGRADDFLGSAVPFSGRGHRLDATIATLRETWDGQGSAIGPRPAHGIPVLVGGHSPAAMRRAARAGDGWIAGGTSATPYEGLARQARRAWTAEGRTDQPRMAAIAFFALGPDAISHTTRFHRDYYGGAYADKAIKATLVGSVNLAAAVKRYAMAGCEELILFPCHADTEQLTLLAKTVLG